MIDISHVVLPSPEQMEFIVEGMRNPMNSWDKSDSYMNHTVDFEDKDDETIEIRYPYYRLGSSDIQLMQKLAKAGTDHRKFMRMMTVCVGIKAPLYWWKEFDTYKVGTVANSCSTMHKIQSKEFTLDDFSHEHLLWSTGDELRGIPELKYYQVPMDILDSTIKCLNFYRELFLETKDKKYWWRMIQLLPSSYNQTRNVTLNYEVLANIYRSRKNHKLDEWREFCSWIESLPQSELITYDKVYQQGGVEAIDEIYNIIIADIPDRIKVLKIQDYIAVEDAINMIKDLKFIKEEDIDG